MLGLLISAVVSHLPRAVVGGAAVSFPQVLFAGAILPCRRPAGDWLVLAVCAAGFFAAAGVLIARMSPARCVSR